MRCLLLALVFLAGPAWAEAGSEAPTERPQLGTVHNPLRVRVGLLGPDGALAAVDGSWERVTRSLLDLQDALVADLDAKLAGTPFQGRRRVRIAVEPELRVLVDVIPDQDQADAVRVRLVDGDGEPVQGATQAWIERGDGAREPLTFASAGEIVIEDLDVAEPATVQVHMGDGDVLVIWLGEPEAAD